MGTRRKLADVVVGAMLGVGRALGRRFYSYFADRLLRDARLIVTVDTRAGPIKMWCPNEITLWRADTLLTKEPETIEWLDGFQPGDVYWDIGGNIGVYALYAAKKPGLRVIAFEPSPLNYFALSRNIEINGLGDTLSAFCLAFCDARQLEYLNMSSFEIGSAMASFGEIYDFTGREFTPVFRQGAIGISIDEFVAHFAPPFPNHIKIDVDSIEGKIVAGAAKTLADPRMKSVSIELDDNKPDEIASVTKNLQRAGFGLQHRKHSAMFENTRFVTANNYLFVRN
jgi:FkbM family methyltransferase